MMKQSATLSPTADRSAAPNTGHGAAKERRRTLSELCQQRLHPLLRMFAGRREGSAEKAPDRPPSHFPETSWSLIGRAGALLSEDRRKALDDLCKAYRSPVYAFIRSRVGSVDEAHDRTQGFFADLLERNDRKHDLAKVDRERGSKFRSWLLACVHHYLSKERKRERTLGRGGGQPTESLDDDAAEGRYEAELSHDLTADRLYERAFAESVLIRVIGKLRDQYAAAGNAPRFDALKGRLSQGTAQRPYKEVAAQLHMTETAVKKAASDLRRVYKKLLRAEVSRLVDHPDDKDEVDEELRQLCAALED